MKVYMAGHVRKSADERLEPDWRDAVAACIPTDSGIELLSPESGSVDESDPRHVVGHAMCMMGECDVVLVDGARALGVGTTMEWILAKYHFDSPMPVIALVPPESPYIRDDVLNHDESVLAAWIHPFVQLGADIITKSAEHAASILMKAQDSGFTGIEGIAAIKSRQVFDDATHFYRHRCTT